MRFLMFRRRGLRWGSIAALIMVLTVVALENGLTPYLRWILLLLAGGLTSTSAYLEFKYPERSSKRLSLLASLATFIALILTGLPQTERSEVLEGVGRVQAWQLEAIERARYIDLALGSQRGVDQKLTIDVVLIEDAINELQERIDGLDHIIHQTALLHHSQSSLQWHIGRDEGAVDSSRRAVALQPQKSDLWTQLCTSLRVNGSLVEALEACERAIELNSENGEAWNNRGSCLLLLGRPDESRAALEIASKLLPSSAAPLINLANLEWYSDNPREALEYARRALELDELAINAYLAMGVAQRALGRNIEALATYKKALELNPDDAQLWNNLGNIYGDIGDLDNSLSCYRKAILLDSEYADAYFTFGYRLNEAGRFEEAIYPLEQALDLNPQDIDAYVELAKARNEVEGLGAARAVIRRASDTGVNKEELIHALEVDGVSFLASGLIDLIEVEEKGGQPRAPKKTIL